MEVKEKYDKKLLVEGNDDKHVIWSLCQQFSVLNNFDVIDCKGVDNLFQQIPVRLKQSGIRTLGIVLDADLDIRIRWQKLQRILKPKGYDLHPSETNDGLIIEKEEGVKLGIWIMPDNKIPGMLEDFIHLLVPEGDILWSKANQVVEQIENKQLNNYPVNQHSKALIHTWLSWQESPGTPLGLAITKKYLNTESELCKKFLAWLQKLFG